MNYINIEIATILEATVIKPQFCNSSSAGGPAAYFHNFSGKTLGILSTQHYYERRDNLLTQH